MIAWNFRVSVERIRCAIAQRIGLDVNLLNSAISVDELHPAEIVTGPPCIVLPGQYERIRACAFGIAIEKEVAELEGAPRTIGATLRYVLESVLISENVLYSRGRHKYFNYKLRLNREQSQPKEFDEIVLRSSFVGCYYFGHWLRDDCATHLLAEQYGTPMSMPTPAWPDCAEYLTLFGQQYDELGEGYVRRLILFDDITQNANKANRFRVLRSRVVKRFGINATGHIVYLTRGAGEPGRTPINEKEIAEALSRRGVIVLQAETLGVGRQIKELIGARIVISVEGSQLSHALYTMSDQGGILVIQPPQRFFTSHMDWARALNIRYSVVVGKESEGGYYLPIDDLLRTIDLLDVELSRNLQ